MGKKANFHTYMTALQNPYSYIYMIRIDEPIYHTYYRLCK